MPSLILSLLKYWKFAGIGVIALGVGLYIWYLKSNISSLQANLEDTAKIVENQKIEMEGLRAYIKVKETEIDLSTSQSEAVAGQLEKCYLRLKETTASMQEIDAIMNHQAPQVEAENTPLENSPAVPEEKVTPAQTKLGLQFVNKQLSRLLDTP